MDGFHPAVSGWFQDRFGDPSPPQRLGWPSIAAGKHTLILAPTGSGKTLAAFLWCLNQLYEHPAEGVQVLYVSPLKALNYDVEKNLDQPLQGIAAKAAELGLPLPAIRKGVRTGDTASSDRASMLRRPPHVLITTPESLYLLLTSQRARGMLRTVRYLIVDEIHAVAGTKRGVHLALSIERLEALVAGSRESPGRRASPDPRLPTPTFVRIGLSATQRPLTEIASFLGGVGRDVSIVDTGARKELDLQVVSPVKTFAELPEHSAWNGVYARVLEYLGRGPDRTDQPPTRQIPAPSPQPPRSTLIFVNNRGVAERVTHHLNELAGEEIARAHHGSLSKDKRKEVEEALKRGELPAIVATSSLELGIDMGSIDLVIQIGSPKSVSRGLQRVGRAGHHLNATATGRVLPIFRSDVLEAAVVAREMGEGHVEETRVPRNCLDVLAQQICAMAAAEEWTVPDLFQVVRRAYSYADLTRGVLDSVLEMLSGRYPSHEFGELRPRIAWDRQNDVIRAREGSRMLAIINGGTIPDRGYFGVYLAESNVKLGELDEEMVFESRVGQTFTLGNSNWRIDAIGHDRVLVSAAPPGAASMPFWHGEGLGRPFELGETVGKFLADAEAALVQQGLPPPTSAGLPAVSPAQAAVQQGVPPPSWAGLPGVSPAQASVQQGVPRPSSPGLPAVSPAQASAQQGVQGPSPAGLTAVSPAQASVQQGVQGPSSAGLTAVSPAQASAQQGVQGPSPAGVVRVSPTNTPSNTQGGQLQLASLLRQDYALDEAAADNLIEFLVEQKEALGALPTRRRLIVERFNDELGEPRVVVHSPFGGRVNGALAFALSRRIRESSGMDVEQLYTDDGIVFRFPAGAQPPRDLLAQVNAENAEDLIVAEVGNSAMFGTIFRQNAARALLLPRQSPSRRSPLWLQRIKAADLLQVARRYESFPIMIETYRECLQEVLDVPHLRQILEEIEAGRIEVQQVETAYASPFAAEMLFSFVMAFMYATDAPRAERNSAMLSLNRDLLSDVLDAKAVRELLEPAAIAQLEGRLQRTLPGWKAESPDELMEVFLRLVDLSGREVAERFEDDAAAALTELLDSGQISRSGERYVPTEYLGWYGADTTELVKRFAANHGPFDARAIQERYGFEPSRELEGLQAAQLVARGAFTPGKTGEEWCLVDNLRQLHRRSLAILREQIEPRDAAQFASFLGEWQGLGSQRTGANGLRQVINQLQGLSLPMEIWEPDILHRRLSGYQPAWLDHLCASGEVVWLGTTTPGGGKGKIAFFFRDEVELLLPAESPPRTLGDNALRVRDWLRLRGASFLQDIASGVKLGQPDVYDALWELVWAGEASNDTFDPVRSPRRPKREAGGGNHNLIGGLSSDSQLPAPARPRHWSYRRDFRRPGLPSGQGRWSLFVPGQPAPAADRAEAYARQLLARYGVVAREMALAEDGPAPWAAVYQVLKRLEAIGQVRRGYFVTGLSGAQFAVPDAVEKLRQDRAPETLVNATDPANPYGALLPFDGDARLTRIGANYLVLRGGRPALAIEGQGRDLRPFPNGGGAIDLLPRMLAVPARIRRLKKLEIETWDGHPVIGSDIQPQLEALGFEKEPQRLTLRPSRL